jgi:hypothetical protein
MSIVYISDFGHNWTQSVKRRRRVCNTNEAISNEENDSVGQRAEPFREGIMWDKSVDELGRLGQFE